MYRTENRDDQMAAHDRLEGIIANARILQSTFRSVARMTDEQLIERAETAEYRARVEEARAARYRHEMYRLAKALSEAGEERMALEQEVETLREELAGPRAAPDVNAAWEARGLVGAKPPTPGTGAA